MPRHTKDKSGDAGAAVGGAGGRRSAAAAAEGESKRGVGGRAIGKAQRAALRKNAKAVADYLDMIEGVRDYKELESAVTKEGLRLGRVIKMLGCARLDVQLQDGTRTTLSISATIRWKGSAASKADRDNSILTGDLIVVRDALAAGKVHPALVGGLEEDFVRVGMMIPSGFFSQGTEADAGAVGWEFDRRPELARLGVRSAAADVEKSDSASDDDDLDVEGI